MSSVTGTSIVANHHHHQHNHLYSPYHKQNGTFTSTSTTASTSSTIYHSPQSSPPNQSSPKPLPMMMITDLNNENNDTDDDDEKPLDFSAKSPSKKQPSYDTELNDINEKSSTTRKTQQTDQPLLTSKSSVSTSKKLHPKFMKRHHHQQPEHHCFTTPSPSPPEHRAPNNLLISPSKQSSNPATQSVENIFGKFFQEMTNQIQPANNNFSPQQQVLNETLLNQALQMSKLNTIPNPSMIDADSKYQNAKTLQLLNLLATVNNQQAVPNQKQNIIEQLLGKNNYPTAPELSPIKSTSDHSLSPTFAASQYQPLVSPPIADTGNGGLLLTTAKPTLNEPMISNSCDSFINEPKIHVKNDPMIGNSTPKYTRPFKALYNNKELPLLSQKHSPSATTAVAPSSSSSASSSSPGLETLAAADSLLSSDQAYLMFRSQMLSMSKQRQSSISRKSHETNRKSSHNTSINSNKSFDLTSDDNSNSSSCLNSNNIVDNNNKAINEISESINSHNNSLVTMPNILNSNPITTTTAAATTTSSGRKRARPLPDSLKDEAYWERRRKNNEAAKRSRDLRRAKEDEIAIRASFLEHENRQLKLKLIEAELKLEKKDALIASLQNQLSLKQ